MSKNKQILIFSAIGLAVLGGVTAVLLLTAPKDNGGESTASTDNSAVQETAGKTEELVLSAREETDTESIEITNSGGMYIIERSGGTGTDGSILWTIDDISSAPLNSSSLSAAVDNAVNFEAKEYAEEVSDSSELAKYGLDSPKAVVKAKFTDGTEFTFSIGNDVPNSTTAVYVTSDGKKVYTAYKSRTDRYLGNVYSFVDLKVTPDLDQSAEEIRRITVERSDLEKPIIIEEILSEDEDDVQVFSYRLVSPYSTYADLTDVPTFLNEMFGLSAGGCEWVGMEGTDYEIAGLNEPDAIITVETNLRTFSLKIGSALTETVVGDDGSERQVVTGYYGMSSEVPGVLYRFSPGSITALTIDPEKLISRSFLMPYIYSLNNISYSDSEGRNLRIDVETIKAQNEDEDDIHSFYISGEKVTDEKSVKNLYQYFISAAGEELYFDDDKGELLAEITYDYIKNENGVEGKDVVRFYSSNSDRKVIVSINGENLFKTRQMYITQLFSNIDNFLNGKDIVLTY